MLSLLLDGGGSKGCLWLLARLAGGGSHLLAVVVFGRGFTFDVLLLD
jgi:hypothetical protein